MEWFISCVTTNYFNFKGRARRKEFWMFGLCYMGVLIAGGVCQRLLAIPHFYNVLTLLMAIPSISVTVRRMHDVGKSGWYQLIPIYSFILMCSEGDRGSNNYGPDPKGDSSFTNIAA